MAGLGQNDSIMCHITQTNDNQHDEFQFNDMFDMNKGCRCHILLSCTLQHLFMTRVYLKKRIATRIANGHPWIFNNEVDKIDGEIDPAGIVEVLTHDKKFIGKGYIIPFSVGDNLL